MTKPPDDYEAVRQFVTTLEGFSADDRERIIRWAREKLGMAAAGSPLAGRHPDEGHRLAPPQSAPAAESPIFVTCVFRREGQPDFSEKDIAKLERIHPFLDCAVKSHT
jgi:hypothetical protein